MDAEEYYKTTGFISMNGEDKKSLMFSYDDLIDFAEGYEYAVRKLGIADKNNIHNSTAVIPIDIKKHLDKINEELAKIKIQLK